MKAGLTALIEARKMVTTESKLRAERDRIDGEDEGFSDEATVIIEQLEPPQQTPPDTTPSVFQGRS